MNFIKNEHRRKAVLILIIEGTEKPDAVEN